MTIKKIAVIHTSPATVESLTTLIKQEFGEIEVVNILDDSILKDLIQKNHEEFVEERWLQYAKIAANMGANAVLSACSSVGEIAEKANVMLEIPVYRIDDAMAEEAVQMGQSICVFATLSSTLEPTVDLIKRKAKSIGKACTIRTVLVPDAYEELIKGNRLLHNQKIQEAVLQYAETSDVLVLAQASMASVIEELVEIEKEKVLTSPYLGVQKLRKEMLRS